MALTFTNGTITTSASEQNLFDVTADKYFATYLFLHNMTGTETFVIKVYIYDANGATYRLYQTEIPTFEEVQNNPCVHIPFMATPQYKVSIQRTAGTDRAVTWLRMEA